MEYESNMTDDENLIVCILAGGEGKRMHSELPKVLCDFNGKPILVHIVEKVRQLPNLHKIIIITGRFHILIINTLSKYMDIFGLHFMRQLEPLGTGDAIKSCLYEIENKSEVLIVSGDIPLITTDILLKFMQGSQGSCNILVAKIKKPHGYGRIVYDGITKEFTKIVEERDCTEIQRNIDIVNTGIYYITGSLLKKYIPLLSNNNSQKEYYLTDIVGLIKANSWDVIDTVLLDECDNIRVSGVNTPEEMTTLLAFTQQ